MAPDGVLQKVVASLKSVGEFDVAALSVTPSSSVYKAVEKKLRRALIIKLMPLAPWGTHRAQMSAMAGAERRIVKGFDFPNIPRLLTGGEVDDHLFWITEFVDGIPLNKTLEMGETLSALDLVDMARQLCASVESTSKSGIVHHRFCPRNMIVEWDGGVKILDWGIPPYTDLGASASAATVQAAHYLAPEQVGGQIGDLRSNLFSVGVILYQLATAQLPFNGGDIALLKASMDGPAPKSPSELSRKIPEGISAPILRAISNNPNYRYQSASELIKDLENYKKYGVKEELPTNFYTQKSSPATPASGLNGSQGSRPQPDVTMELDSAWTPAVTASKPRDVAVMSMQDSMVAVADRATEVVAPPTEVLPVKETVYTEPESKPAVQAKPKIPLPKIKPPKITVKDVNRWVNRIPPLTAALMFGAVVVLFLAWKIIVPYTIVKDSPTSSAPVQQPVAQTQQTPAPVTESVPESPAPTTQETPAEPEVVVRSFDKNGRKISKKKVTSVPVPVAPSFGELSINSEPAGASFQVDGRSDGNFVTPFTVSQLAPGRHVITFSKPGYQTQTLASEVIAGARATIMMARLAAQGGTVSIGSTPNGAAITLDGHETGRVTPAQVILPHGPHTVSLKLPGYLEATQSVNAVDGQSHSVAMEMIAMGRTIEIKTTKKGLFGLAGKGDKDMGTVNIRTNPNGAAVLINGQLGPKATPLEFKLNPGGYELTFQLRGYKTHKKVIVVEAGSKLSVNENLELEQ